MTSSVTCFGYITRCWSTQRIQCCSSVVSMEVTEYVDLLQYLTDRTYRPDISKNAKRRLREVAVVRGRQRRLDFGSKGKFLQKVVKNGDETALMLQLHAGVVGGGHFSINITHAKVDERYWWPTMTEYIRHIVRTCERYVQSTDAMNFRRCMYTIGRIISNCRTVWRDSRLLAQSQ